MSDIDDLVDRAVAAVATLARRGSTLTTGVAIVAAIVVGITYLIGLAAFGGGTRAVWAVVGAVLLLLAVGAPLLASFRLRSIPRKADSLVGELRTLLNRDESAKRIVIDTVEAEPDAAAAPTTDARFGGGFAGARSPAVVLQFQRFSTLRGFATSDDVKNLAKVAQNIGSLPGLIAGAFALMGISAMLGFIFLLIWIF